MPQTPDPNHIACFFATSGHSGVDRIVKNLLPGMVAAGYSVDLLKIQEHGPQLSGEGHGVRVIELKAKHVYTALPELVSYLRRERPTVLLTDKDKVNRTAILARRMAGTQTRLSVRIGTTVSVNLKSRGIIDRFLQRISMRYLYRSAEAVLMPSDGAADDFSKSTGLSRQLITVVPSPIVTPDFKIRSEEPIDHSWFQEDEPPVILGVGELSSRKDFATLLRAFAAMPDNGSYRLVILGRGQQKSALQILAEQLNIADRFYLPGFVPNPYPYMKRARLFAMTSRWEGMPVALIEALALGIPVVATDCPSGPREVLDNGRFGPLVPIRDVQALTQAMSQLLNSPPRRETLLEAAEPYHLENSLSRYLAAMGFTKNGIEAT